MMVDNCLVNCLEYCLRLAFLATVSDDQMDHIILLRIDLFVSGRMLSSPPIIGGQTTKVVLSDQRGFEFTQFVVYQGVHSLI